MASTPTKCPRSPTRCDERRLNIWCSGKVKMIACVTCNPDATEENCGMTRCIIPTCEHAFCRDCKENVPIWDYLGGAYADLVDGKYIPTSQPEGKVVDGACFYCMNSMGVCPTCGYSSLCVGISGEHDVCIVCTPNERTWKSCKRKRTERVPLPPPGHVPAKLLDITECTCLTAKKEDASPVDGSNGAPTTPETEHATATDVTGNDAADEDVTAASSLEDKVYELVGLLWRDAWHIDELEGLCSKLFPDMRRERVERICQRMAEMYSSEEGYEILDMYQLFIRNQ